MCIPGLMGGSTPAPVVLPTPTPNVPAPPPPPEKNPEAPSPDVLKQSAQRRVNRNKGINDLRIPLNIPDASPGLNL